MSLIIDLRRRSHKPGLGASAWAARLAILVSGALSAFIFAFIFSRTAVPYSAGILAAVIPRLWTSARVWLVPPYLFVTVNLIILAIWMLSGRKFYPDHYPEEEKSQPLPQPDSPVAVKPIALVRNPSPLSPAASGGHTAKSGESVPDPWSESSCLTAEEPDEVSTASSRLETKRSSDLISGKALEPEEEDDDSMEAKWKAIMARGAAPVVRRSDTMERLSSPATPAANGDAGHAVLNRRFEEFIKKNYEQIN